MNRIAPIVHLITRTVLLGSLLLLCSCDTSKLTNHKEWECLDSEKLNFNDPTSVKFVANLGMRGEDGDHFWVRYMAKNSYGAYRQGNMKCFEMDGWKRDTLGESFAMSAVIDQLKSADHDERMDEYRKMGRGDPYDLSPYSDAAYKDRAEEIVHQGTGNLPTAKFIRRITEEDEQRKDAETNGLVFQGAKLGDTYAGSSVVVKDADGKVSSFDVAGEVEHGVTGKPPFLITLGNPSVVVTIKYKGKPLDPKTYINLPGQSVIKVPADDKK